MAMYVSIYTLVDAVVKVVFGDVAAVAAVGDADIIAFGIVVAVIVFISFCFRFSFHFFII